MANEAKITVKADASDVSGKLKNMRGSFLALGAAGTAVVGAIALSVTSFAKAGDEIQKMGLRTGFTTESLSELKFALEQSGTNIEGFEKGIRRMSSFIADGRDGLTETTRALDSLGIQVDDFKGKSPEDSFDILAGALAGVTDATMQSALAQDIFGRSGTALIPLLKQGEQGIAALRKEAHDLGIVFDQDAANAAARLVDAQNTLTKSVDGVKFAIAEGLAPAISGIAEGLAGTVSKVSEFARENPLLTKTVVALALGLGGLAIAVAGIGLVLPLMATGLGFVTVGFIGLNIATGGVLLAIAALVVGIVLLIKNWDAVVHAISVGVNFMLGAVELYVNGWIKGLNIIIEGINKLGAVFGLSIDTIAEVELPRWQHAMKETEEVIADSTDAIIEDNEETGKSFSDAADEAESASDRIRYAVGEVMRKETQAQKNRELVADQQAKLFEDDQELRERGIEKEQEVTDELAKELQERADALGADAAEVARIRQNTWDFEQELRVAGREEKERELARDLEDAADRADAAKFLEEENRAAFDALRQRINMLPSVIGAGIGTGGVEATGDRASVFRAFKASQNATTDQLAAARAQLASGNFGGGTTAEMVQAEIDRLVGIVGQKEILKGGEGADRFEVIQAFVEASAGHKGEKLGQMFAPPGGFGSGAPPSLPGVVNFNFNGDVVDIEDSVAKAMQNLTDQGFVVAMADGVGS